MKSVLRTMDLSEASRSRNTKRRRFGILNSRSGIFSRVPTTMIRNSVSSVEEMDTAQNSRTCTRVISPSKSRIPKTRRRTHKSGQITWRRVESRRCVATPERHQVYASRLRQTGQDSVWNQWMNTSSRFSRSVFTMQTFAPHPDVKSSSKEKLF